MNKLIKVLVTGAGSLLGQGIIRSLINSKLKIHLTAVDPDPLAVGLYWADSKYLIPMVNDREYFDRVFELIDSADKSIHLVMFEIKYYDKYPDSEVNQLVEKLIKKNSEGVEVKIIVDQFLTDKRAVEILQKTGVDIKWDSTKLTTHNKLMIIDGRVVLIGSTNWSYYSFSKNHESNVIFHDEESAKKFEQYFERVWLES